jgi:hypothetical protein
MDVPPAPATAIPSHGPNQTKVIDLLREVHLIAFKEIERLNMRIVELENQHRQATVNPTPKPAAKELHPVHPATIEDAAVARCVRTPERTSGRKVPPIECCRRASMATVPRGSKVFEDRRCRSISTGQCRNVAQFLSCRNGFMTGHGKAANSVDRASTLLFPLVGDLVPPFDFVCLATGFCVMAQKSDVLVQVRHRFLFSHSFSVYQTVNRMRAVHNLLIIKITYDLNKSNLFNGAVWGICSLLILFAEHTAHSAIDAA